MLSTIFGVELISLEKILILESACKASSHGRARICMHANPNDELHVMLIAVVGHHKISCHASRTQGKMLFIMQRGRIKLKYDGNDITMVSIKPSAIYIDKTKRRSLINLDASISLYWEVHVGPHHSYDTLWLDELDVHE